MYENFTPDYPCRDNLYESLSKYIQNKNEAVPPFLYLYGHSGTGKTIIMKNICKQIGKEISSFVNCIECFTPKILYESVIDNLRGHSLTIENNYSSSVKCENAADFIQALSQLPTSSSYILCFDNAERLRNIDANVFPLLVNLRDISQLNICTIFITTIPIEKMGSICEMPVISIYWPQYNKNEYIIILLKRFDYYINFLNSCTRKIGGNVAEKLEIIKSFDEQFLENYLKLFIEMVYRVNRDINELMFVSCEYFEKYCEPILNGNVKLTDLQKLRINFVQKFKSQNLNIYKRIDQEPQVVSFLFFIRY